jgi:hypothetical protein
LPAVAAVAIQTSAVTAKNAFFNMSYSVSLAAGYHLETQLLVLPSAESRVETSSLRFGRPTGARHDGEGIVSGLDAFRWR